MKHTRILLAILTLELGGSEIVQSADIKFSKAVKVLREVGSEGKGIRKKVIEHCDFLGEIPMQGNANSLNVSAAVSAILFERLRQIKLK